LINTFQTVDLTEIDRDSVMKAIINVLAEA
jgi:hypothetical protein